MRLRALLLAVPLAVAGLAVPAYADDSLTVSWPTWTDSFNDTGSFDFTVSDAVPEPERGLLYAEWMGERQEIPHAGHYTMSFHKGGTGTVTVVRCVQPAGDPPPAPVCTDTGVTSPQIHVSRSVALPISGVDMDTTSGTYDAQIHIPEAPNTQIELRWAVGLQSGGGAVTSGSPTVTTDGEGRAQFSYRLPSGRDDYYFLEVYSTFDLAPFGPHRTSSHWSIFVDGRAPVLALRTDATSFYPATDRYRDWLKVTASTNEPVKYAVEVRNAAGALVRRLSSGSVGAGQTITRLWNGRSSSGALVKAGTYTIEFRGVDRVGRSSVVRKKVTVSHKRLVKKTWKRTFSAAAALAGPKSTYVGKCSTLRKPSQRGWAGSFGFYSQTKCSKPSESAVLTVSGVFVPKAFQSRYGTFQVLLNGGGAKSGGKRHGRNAYIVMYYRNTARKDVQRVQFNGALGSHAGRSVAAGNFVWAKSAKPYVLWFSGLSEGSRYDVKSYTVKLTYTALQ